MGQTWRIPAVIAASTASIAVCVWLSSGSQPATSPLVGTTHLGYQVGTLADQVMQQIGCGRALAHGTAPAIHATSSTANNTSMSLFTSITNTSVNYKC